MRNREKKDCSTVLKYQVNKELLSKFSPGESRKEAKKIGEADSKIFSFNTLEVYKKNCGYFCDWIEKNHPESRKLEDAKKYVPEYFEHLIKNDYSAYSQKSYLSALRKLYDYDLPDIYTEKRSRSDIFRGRNETESNRKFSEEKHQDLVYFLQHTGLRRSEAENLHGGAISLHSDGHYYIDGVKGKGGKIRDIRVLNDDIEVINKVNETPPDQKVWGLISKHCNIHGYRADYAEALYLSEARDVSQLSYNEIYHCQKDYLGLELDKSAMMTVSESLGHSRLNVIAENYLYNLI